VVEDPRTLQANERTLLAWLRTGVSLITFGFVIAKSGTWLQSRQPLAIRLGTDLIGTVFVALGALTETIGVLRYLRIRRALLEQRPAPTGATEIVAIGVAVALLGFLLSVFTIL
jgi:putative membrane protein